MKKFLPVIVLILFLFCLLAAAGRNRSLPADAPKDADRAAVERTIRASIGWALNKDFNLLYESMAQDPDFFIFHPDTESTIVGFEAFKKLAESTLRLPGMNAGACSGLTLSRASRPRLERRGLASANGSTWKSDKFKALDFEVKDLRIRFGPAGDVAWYSALLDDHGEWDGRPTGWDNARWTGVLEKRGGRWVIIQMHFSFGTDQVPFTPVHTSPYLGQKPPGDKAALFAPGLVSTGMTERDVAMTPDGREIYYGLAFGGIVTIMAARFENGRWTEPAVASFAATPDYFHFEPCLSADGKRILFLTTRPQAGEAPKPGWGHENIWAADRKPDGSWGEPYDLGAPINTKEGEFYPSLTRDGTLYFTRSGADGSKPTIMRARPADGGYRTPEPLPAPVNGKETIFNATISRDESFLVACVDGRKDSVTPGLSNYYIFFRSDDDRWSEPVNLGPEINFPGASASSCSLSPDGTYFFFASTKSRPLDFASGPVTIRKILDFFKAPRNGDSDIYWIDASFIGKLK